MKYLVDTNVLLRWSHADISDHLICTKTIDSLLEAGYDPCICAQVLIEFWVVATRSKDVNGLGLTLSEAKIQMVNLREIFTCLLEVPDIADRWQRMAERYSVKGKQAHDARIATLMLTHGITRILTLNPDDFARYKGITPITPQDLLRQLNT